MSLIKTEADTAAGAIEISPTPSIPSSADPQPFLAMSAPQDSVSTDSSTANSEPTPSAPIHNPVSSSPQSQSQPVADGMSSTGNSNEPLATNDVSASGIMQTSALERGPLGLAPDEEEWIKSRMEYAVHDFQVLTLAIKRYRWQLSQVPKDISRLQSLKEKHMDDPFEFLRQIKSKEFFYPEGQKTLPAPSIEWTKYQFPPANPVVPTKPQGATFLNSVSFSTGHERGRSNIVSLASSSRSRAGSPSYERLRTVKDMAKSLGIQATHHHHHNVHHLSHEAGAHAMRIDSSVGDNSAGEPRVQQSRQASQEVSQLGHDHSHSPGVVSRNSEMEGVSYTGQETPAAVHRERSVTAPESTLALVGPSFYSTLPDPPSPPPPPQQQLQPHPQAQAQSLQPYQATSHIQPLPPSYTAPQNQTIDHSAGLNSVPHSSHNNITYNHMSGSVDIFPVAPKGKTTLREDSGTREESKPPLYNIPWSDEEQQLLEKLLDEFPDEPVAAQRFQKISAAMGTRTPKQVASRVQKYFIKLVKAGLEAPGRMNYSLESKPKNKGTAANIKGKKRKDAPVGEGVIKPKASRPKKKDPAELGQGTGTGYRRQKAKSLFSTGSGRTSGTQYLHYSSAPTVYMSEEDDEESVQDMLAVSNNSNTPGSDASNNGITSHLGFACDACGVDPIPGVRYSCLDCEDVGGTDLCGPCYAASTYQNDHHLLSHRFHLIETAEVPAYGHDYRPASVGPSGTSGIYSIYQ